MMDVLLHLYTVLALIWIFSGVGTSAVTELIKKWLTPLRRRQVRRIYRRGTVVVLDRWWWQALISSIPPLLGVLLGALVLAVSDNWPNAAACAFGGLTATMVYFGFVRLFNAFLDGMSARLKDKNISILSPNTNSGWRGRGSRGSRTSSWQNPGLGGPAFERGMMDIPPSSAPLGYDEEGEPDELEY